ncbi:MAG: hypothetical protein KBS96_05510 [Lachnospiraceae bacterium]|nr:hypothetical protein [Candidatus Colinaster scatohippi]
MFDRIFASYLVETGKLTDKSLGEIYSSQEQKRVRLGVIAVSEKLMSIEQVEEVNQLQAIYDKRFGDIAVEKGYLTDEQVSRLLVLQGNAFLAFMQSVTDCGAMTIVEFNEALDEFQKKYSFTLANMEDLKSCDNDRIIPIFVYDQPEMIQKLCGIMVRTLARLVDYHVYIMKPTVSTTVDFPAICVQELQGQHRIVTSLSGEIDGSMFDTAVGFAGSENVVCDEDCMDALCELINCVNGLLATEMSSRDIDIDMDAPYAQGTPGSIKSEEILTLPIIIYGKQLNLNVILDKDYTI